MLEIVSQVRVLAMPPNLSYACKPSQSLGDLNLMACQNLMSINCILLCLLAQVVMPCRHAVPIPTTWTVPRMIPSETAIELGAK